MPLYGQAFTLNSDQNTGLNAPANKKGKAGPFTRAAGFLAYYEICDMVKNQGWNVVKDPEGRMGPYAYKDRNWVGYDDVNMIRYKSEYIRKMGLGGGMVWALDLDDFKNRCGQGHHPLMNTIKEVLGPKITAEEQEARTRSKPVSEEAQEALDLFQLNNANATDLEETDEDLETRKGGAGKKSCLLFYKLGLLQAR